MSFAAVILTPLVLLLPMASAIEAVHDQPFESVAPAPWSESKARVQIAAERPEFPLLEPWALQFLAHKPEPGEARQVRIEQRMTIRVSPRPAPVRRDMFVGIPQEAGSSRFIERQMGECVSVSDISGVRTEGGRRLILFMRDGRVISAELENACHARHFYSGFYLTRSSDGQLCVDRDSLHSRSGLACKLSRLRQFIVVRD